MKRKIAEFTFKVYKTDDNQIELAFDKAKKVPKTFDNFVAALEIAALNVVQKIMHGIEKGKDNGKNGNVTCEQRTNADNQSNPA